MNCTLLSVIRCMIFVLILYSVTSSHDFCSAIPVKAQNRTAFINVRWDSDFGTFYRNLINEISKTHSYKGVPKSSLWQPYYGPAERLHTHLNESPDAASKKATIQINADAWYDNTFSHNNITHAGLFIAQIIPSSDDFYKSEIKKDSLNQNSKMPVLPWTHEMLRIWKKKELDGATISWEKEFIEEKYYRGEQVLKNWSNRYGDWGNGMDDWGIWFNDNMTPTGGFYPHELWYNFQREWAAKKSFYVREEFINFYLPLSTRNELLCQVYKDELRSRDPTDLNFIKEYEKYIDPHSPTTIVDPPLEAQQYPNAVSIAKPLSTADLISEINRLKEELSQNNKKGKSKPRTNQDCTTNCSDIFYNKISSSNYNAWTHTKNFKKAQKEALDCINKCD